MVKKVYTNDDSDLEVFLNKENTCSITIDDSDDISGVRFQCIKLNESDLEELIKDLNLILEEIKQTNE